MTDIHEVFIRDLERMVVRCLLRGRRLHWVVTTRGQSYDEALLIEDGSDGLASELGVWYGVSLGRVKTVLTAPVGGPRHGSFVIERCRIKITSPMEVTTWRYPRNDVDWQELYMLTKTIVLDAAAFPNG